MAARIRVGTCSWADEALSKYFYPQGLPAGERLAYYAEQFDTVELDSTYYRLPVETMAERWVEQTPDDFVMHVKAFGVMTRHPVKKEQLPTDLRDEAPVDDRTEGGDRVAPRAAEEFSCSECFLLVRRSQFSTKRTDCPGGLDGADCPVKHQLGLA